jgi:hypothetical protein
MLAGGVQIHFLKNEFSDLLLRASFNRTMARRSPLRGQLTRTCNQSDENLTIC